MALEPSARWLAKRSLPPPLRLVRSALMSSSFSSCVSLRIAFLFAMLFIAVRFSSTVLASALLIGICILLSASAPSFTMSATAFLRDGLVRTVSMSLLFAVPIMTFVTDATSLSDAFSPRIAFTFSFERLSSAESFCLLICCSRLSPVSSTKEPSFKDLPTSLTLALSRLCSFALLSLLISRISRFTWLGCKASPLSSCACKSCASDFAFVLICSPSSSALSCTRPLFTSPR